MDKVEQYAFESLSMVRSYPHIDGVAWSNLENGRLFSHLLSVDISGNVFEIPVFLADLAREAKIKGVTEIVLPMFNNYAYGLINRKMAGTILHDFMRTRFNQRLTGVKSNSGNIYYGCPGLILDENFEPLFMLTFRLQYDPETRAIQVLKCICRVPQSVLSRQEELIPKTIYKKLIPLYCTTPARVVRLNGSAQSLVSGKKVEVILDSNPSIIVSPILPRPEQATDETFDRILSDYVDNLVTLNEDDY